VHIHCAVAQIREERAHYYRASYAIRNTEAGIAWLDVGVATESSAQRLQR
jgi:hypothetical protein